MSPAVAFVTLFLNLVVGHQAVIVDVSPDVVSVELRLDGVPVESFSGPDWSQTVDFGPNLLPHEMVAEALDAEGQVIGRAVQWVNLPRPRAEAVLALETRPDRPPAARLYYQSALARPPDSIRLELDGLEVAGQADGTIPLRGVDLGDLHVLTAELDFPSGLVARADLVFGGPFMERARSDLTAVPIVVDGPPPTLRELEGRLHRAGVALKPVAIEQEAPIVYFVREERVRRQLNRASPIRISQVEHLRLRAGAGGGPAIRMVNPRGRCGSLDGGAGLDLFALTSEFPMDRRSMPVITENMKTCAGHFDAPHLGDAVAVAGVNAAAGRRPRAVLLLFDPRAEDESRFAPEAVRRYLEALRVPLVVWTTDETQETAWGSASWVAGPRAFRNAFKTIQEELDRQWIVWLEGDHPVHEIDATDLILAGSPEHELAPPAEVNSREVRRVEAALERAEDDEAEDALRKALRPSRRQLKRLILKNR